MRKLFVWFLSVVSVLTLLSCGSGGSSSDDIVDTSTAVIDDVFPDLPNFTRSLAAFQAPGDGSRWFVVEQAGRIRVFDNVSGVDSFSTFLDISGRVNSGPNEAGLLGMAFHPNFAVNGQVYLSYTVTGSPLTSLVSMFVSNDGGLTLDPTTEQVILRIDQDDTNHNGGQIGFGPDGYLYIGSGDGGGSGDPLDRAEDTTNLLGAMLRVDVDSGSPYGIPSSNPFSGNDFCASDHSNVVNCPELYAWGLRNPWRWSFDTQTGELWVGDVGQGSREEINIVEVGENYGWDHREGTQCFEPASGCQTVDLVDPIEEYGRSEGQSVTGGYVDRSTSILSGQYLFGDFVSGTIWTINTGGASTRSVLLETSLSIASFAQDVDGAVYVIDLSGRIYLVQDS